MYACLTLLYRVVGSLRAGGTEKRSGMTFYRLPGADRPGGTPGQIPVVCYNNRLNGLIIFLEITNIIIYEKTLKYNA